MKINQYENLCLDLALAFVFILMFFSWISVADAESFPRRNAVVKAVESVSEAVVNISSEYKNTEHRNPFAGFGMDSFFHDFFERRLEPRRKLTSLGSGVIINGER